MCREGGDMKPGIEFKGKDFERFLEKVKIADKKAPDKIYKGMDKIGRKVRKELVDSTPVSRINKPDNKRLKRKWRRNKTVKSFNSYEAKIRNTAPHFHLVEHGHRLVTKSGRHIGHVEGKHFTQDVLDRVESDVDEAYEDMIDEILGDIFD